MFVLHPYLKRNTNLKIYNPQNLKSVDVRVKKNSNLPAIYKLVITKKTAVALDLDEDNPFVEIIQTKKNKKFIAKKADMFDEEKKVAIDVPVNTIEIDELMYLSTCNRVELIFTTNKTVNNIFLMS